MLIATPKLASPSLRRRGNFRRIGSEDGAIAIMAAFVIIIMIAMFGMAIDLSRGYNRKAELQSVADATALIAAASLDGTSTGIDRALAQAELAVVDYTFSYSKSGIAWSSAALTFGTGADGGPDGWVSANAAKANASKMIFARVDTSALAPSHGKVQNYLMPVLSSALAETNVVALAVAGRDSLNVLPLAICANSNTPVLTPPPAGELVEYGFRRGVSYDLMNLNPGGRTPENFLLNPVAPPGTVGTTMKDKLSVVAPFICTGKMAMPTLRGGDLTVERGFPINLLYEQLNSRFGTYASPCLSATAPTDQNVTQFTLANATWMKYRPDGLAANTLMAPGDPLLTIADKPTGATRTAYGPLWSYARAAKHASYDTNGGQEPAGGYETFAASEWGQIYTPGFPEPQSYPGTTPYQSTGGSPTYKPYRNTRLLHVPLLHCPVPTGASATAAVVGIAKFFMTVPASSSALYAEFAGMDNEGSLGGNVRLYR